MRFLFLYMLTVGVLLHSACSYTADEEEFSLISLSAKTDSSLSQQVEVEEPASIVSRLTEQHNEPPVMQRARQGYVMNLSGLQRSTSQLREAEEPMIVASAQSNNIDDTEGPDIIGGGPMGLAFLAGNPSLCATIQRIIGDASVSADGMDIPELNTLSSQEHAALIKEIKARKQALDALGNHDALFWQKVDEIRAEKKQCDEKQKQEPAPRFVPGKGYRPSGYLVVQQEVTEELYELLKNGYTPSDYLQKEHDRLTAAKLKIAFDHHCVENFSELQLRLQAITFLQEHRPEHTALFWQHLDLIRAKITQQEKNWGAITEVARLMNQARPEMIFPPMDGREAPKVLYINDERKRLYAIIMLLKNALCIANGKN